MLSLVPAAAGQGTLWIAGLAMALFAGAMLLVVGGLLYVLTMLAGQVVSRVRRQ